MPKVKVDTWKVYRQQFYIVTALSISLIISSLLWGSYLLREVSRRKEIQGNLENQISFRKALSDSLPTPSYVINSEGLILSHNSAFSQYFTHEYYVIASLPLTHPDSPFSIIMADFGSIQLDEYENRPVESRELEISNGKETRNIQHWMTLCEMPASSDRIFICGWEDITETRSLIHELEIEKNKAINTTMAKSQFLATMSHEIRTPVSSIMGFLELLMQQSQKEEEKEEAIKLAYSTGESLLGIIGEILDVDKIESGKYHIQPRWIDMAEHLTVIFRTFSAIAARKKIPFVLKNELNHDHLLMIDPQAIKQVTTNLLSNALKFTQKGCVKLSTRLVTRDDTSYRLIIEVADSGSGISEDEKKLLFKPYSQTSSGRQQTGSGLGLMICKQLVSNMQGEISVESHPGIGSIFYVAVPVLVMPRQYTDTNEHQTSIKLPSNLRILVADDHLTNRLLLKRQLSNLGYNVTEACDGKEALDKVKIQPFDLLITDVNMPILNGFELTQMLRKENIPLTIWGLTANAQAQERDRGLSSGMDLCLFKPLTLNVLKQHLSQMSTDRLSSDDYQHLDLTSLGDNTANDPELIREILTTFIESTQKDIQMARKTLKQQDWHTFKKHIHRIHGSAGILNLVRLREVCQYLESISTWSNLELTKNLMETLDDIYLVLEDEIRRYLDVSS